MDKKKVCKECKKEVDRIFSRGRCYYCSCKYYAEKMRDKEKTYKRERQPKLTKFFNYMIDKCTISEETGKKIINPTRANVCHILDKSRHPSVSTEENNILFLTMDEHARFDKLLYEHRFDDLKEEFPNSWELMKQRLELVIPNCQENTKFLKALIEEMWKQEK